MKKIVIILAVVLAVLIAVTAGFLYRQSNYLTLGDRTVRRDTQVLDLSGQSLPDPEQIAQLTGLKELDLRNTGLTIRQYEYLHAALPECTIYWLVPFQGSYLEPGTESLTVTSISEEDYPALRQLKGLKQIDAGGCTDLDAVQQLIRAFPDLRISYTVPLGTLQIPSYSTELTVEDADPAELEQALARLPEVTQVICTGRMPDNDRMLALKQAFPQVSFLWDFDFFGRTVSSDAAQIELDGVAIASAEELGKKLGCFNKLEKLVVLNSGLPSEELDKLQKQYPDTRIVWNVAVGRMDLRTDITTFMPYQHGYTGADSSTRLYDRDCGEMKYLVDLVCIDIGHMWVNDISFTAYMPNLEYFLCCGCGVKDISPLAGLQKLKYVELFSNPFTDVSALAQCPALEDINLSYIHIEDVTPLLGMKQVKNLWLSASYLSEEQKAAVSQALPDANIVFHQMRSTGFGWRELPNYYAQRDLLGMPYMVTEMYKN